MRYLLIVSLCLITSIEAQVNNFDERDFFKKVRDSYYTLVDDDVNNYRLDSLSPARMVGDIQIASEVPFDIVGTQRTSEPDLGAYQFVPGKNDRW